MPGLGEGHHGRVYDESDSGVNLNAHHGVRKFVGSYWVKRKWGRPLIFAYFFLYKTHPCVLPFGPSFGCSNLFPKDLWARQRKNLSGTNFNVL